MVRFTVGRMMGAVAVVGVALRDVKLAVLLILAGGAVVAAWSLVAGKGERRARAWAVPYFASLASLYLPFVWVLGGYPWDGYRWSWIKLWPVLPGLIAGIFAHPNDVVMEWVSGAVAVGLVFLLARVGTSGRKAMIAANGIALVGAGAESWLAYQLFLF